MSYATAKAALDALPADADPLAHAGETVYDWRPYFVSYRTLRAMLPAAVVATLAGAVAGADALAHQMLLVPGDATGTGGGIDLALPESRGMVASLTGPVLTAEQAALILDLARANPRPRHQTWGLSSFDADALRRLPLLAAWEAMSQEVDTIVGHTDTVKDVPGASYRGVAAADLPAVRDALVGLVQGWKAQVDADADCANMPLTGDAAWAAVQGGG